MTHGALNETFDKGAVSLTSKVLNYRRPMAWKLLPIPALGRSAHERDTYAAR